MGNKSYNTAELIKARDEGRILVLPVPFGSTLYMVVSKSKSLFDFREENWFAYVKKTTLKPSNLLRAIKEYGRTFFVNEEEAKAIADLLNKEALAGKYEDESLIKQRGEK